MMLFGRTFFARHQEATTWAGSGATSPSDFTAEYSVWQDMYRKDRYARDRVMKSARMLLPYLKDTDTILDVGCFTHEARKYFPRTINYIGIDQKKYHPKTQVADLNHGFTPISCHHALCLETLEHLLDPEDTLQSILDSVQPGGIVVISLPNETTLFHRIRSLLGVVDMECFSPQGKHLHLPSLKQSRAFLSKKLQVHTERFYISPSAYGSKQVWVGQILKALPDSFHQFLADKFPSLFARGFIFLCTRHGEKPQEIGAAQALSRSTPARPDQIKVT